MRWSHLTKILEGKKEVHIQREREHINQLEKIHDKTLKIRLSMSFSKEWLKIRAGTHTYSGGEQ
jgi:hypothetical protein